MDRKKELELCMQDLTQVESCRRISVRFHHAAGWLDSNGRGYQRDELVANIVIGGTEGKISDSLTYGEIQCISRQYEWFLRQEQALLQRIERLRAEIEVEPTENGALRYLLEDSWFGRQVGQEKRDELKLIQGSRRGRGKAADSTEQ